MTKYKIFGFAGNMRFGKDEAANHLAAKNPEWARKSFASALKKLYCDVFQKDQDFLEEWKVKPEPPPGFIMNVRKSLQFIGDGFRHMKPDIWLDLTFRDQNNHYIISDVRYINEMKAIKERGGKVIVLYRPGFENNDKNASEAQVRKIIQYLRQYPFEGSLSSIRSKFVNPPDGVEFVDYFIWNEGTLQDLYAKVDKYVLTESDSSDYHKPYRQSFIQKVKHVFGIGNR